MSDQIQTVINLGKGKIRKYSNPTFATIYKLRSKIDLLTGLEEPFNGSHLIDLWGDQGLSDSKKIFHLFYELGHLIEGIESKTFEKQNPILAIEIHYQDSCDELAPTKGKHTEFLEFHREMYGVYQAAFKSGYDALMRGDCYQFNLTYPFRYEANNPESFESLYSVLFSKQDHVGAYAHATSLPSQDKVLLSNSPECLFQAEFEKEFLKVWTMPIKGTIGLSEEESFEEKWKELQSSIKDQAELYMITDLLRNDLSRIEMTPSKVIKKKLPLKVPGLLHQYSLIEVNLSKSTTLKRILKGLFPGGSITGAPKKRVMSILDVLENEPRGFYCGSTVILDEDIMAASINIRSAEYTPSTKLLKVHAGGGITLESSCDQEYLEMQAKKESFLSLFL
ncbi:MAG: chorismate-binding protein [Bacteriovoracaceae bacterium]|nr:chorismate-binding protein [Bacteriovoracaceae bacterium]